MAKRPPSAWGVKVTSTLQLCWTASEEAVQESLVSVKSPGLVPVRATVVMLRTSLPQLVSRTV